MSRRRSGLRFRERMHGTLARGAEDCLFERAGELSWGPLSLDLGAVVPDIGEFLRAPGHPIGFERGVVESGHFGPCTVTDATINLLESGTEAHERTMRYRVVFRTASGEDFTLFGLKDIKGSRFQPWYDTTRIFVEVYRGEFADGERRPPGRLVAVGVLQIPALTFLVQLTTFRPIADDPLSGVAALARFMGFFARNIVAPYWVGLFRRTRGDVRHARRPPEPDELRAWASSSLGEAAF